MSVLPLKTYDDPVLRTSMRSVDELTDDLLSLIDDMKESMYAHNGVGLAAPQIGQPLKITVMDCSENRDGSEQICMINPEILDISGAQEGTEGCLSLPGIWGNPHRAQSAKARYLSPEGEIETIERDGLWARCIQHEVDHLESTLFIDHLKGEEKERADRRFDALRTWEDDPSERLDEALSWEAYVEGEGRFVEFNRTRYEKLMLPASQKSGLDALSEHVHMVVLTELSNYEAGMIVPIFARVAEECEPISLHLLPVDDHRDLLDYYRTYGYSTSPVLIALNESHQEIGVWGPRPGHAEKLLDQMDEGEVPDAEQTARLEQYYNERGVTDVMDELRSLLISSG